MRNKNKLKIKGRYLYFCEYNPFLSQKIIMRKVRIRMATFTNNDTLLIVGDNFREEIPTQHANDDEFIIHLLIPYNKEKIITTNKQDIARFIRKKYVPSQTVASYTANHFTGAALIYRSYITKLKNL